MSMKEQDKQELADEKVLSGISSVFEIICQVKLKIWQNFASFPPPKHTKNCDTFCDMWEKERN